MQRLLAVLLVLIGLAGLALGRLGETTWAPATETTATVALEDPGPAVVIDPGVLYVGGEQGEVVIEGASDVSVITASNDDIAAYLDGVHHTRITGASDWSTLSTEEVEPDGEAELSDPTASDLWRTVDTQPSPYTLDVHEFWSGENGENEQVYRAILIVTDGTSPGADEVSITWPVEAENEWVPFAYAGGAAVAVVGLVLLVVSLSRRRDGTEDELEAPVAPGEQDPLSDGEPSRSVPTDVPEEKVWSLGEDRSPEDPDDPDDPEEAADRDDTAGEGHPFDEDEPADLEDQADAAELAAPDDPAGQDGRDAQEDRADEDGERR